MKIDAHQHFWQYNPGRDTWITDDMKIIRRDFLPDDLYPILQRHGFQGSIAVQADQSLEETTFLLDLASEYPWLKGVVGWIDLQARDVEEQLALWEAEAPNLKGLRHIAQSEPNDFLVSRKFLKGMEALNKTRFTYDILIFPPQLPAAIQLVSKFPDQAFVLDHLAKPYIKTGNWKQWAKDLRQLAIYENVYCKVSGMVTEADWQGWQKTDFQPYLEIATNAFGTNRLLFGSDFPVCLVAANYKNMLSIVEDFFETFSETEQQQIFGQNAMEFYEL